MWTRKKGRIRKDLTLESLTMFGSAKRIITLVIIGLLGPFVFVKEVISEPCPSVFRLELAQFPSGHFCFTNEEWRGFYAVNFVAGQTTYAMECDKFFAESSEPTRGKFTNKSEAISKKYDKFFTRYFSILDNFIVRYNTTLKNIFLGQMAESLRLLRSSSRINAEQCLVFLKELDRRERDFYVVDAAVTFGGEINKNPKPCN